MVATATPLPARPQQQMVRGRPTSQANQMKGIVIGRKIQGGSARSQVHPCPLNSADPAKPMIKCLAGESVAGHGKRNDVRVVILVRSVYDETEIIAISLAKLIDLVLCKVEPVVRRRRMSDVMPRLQPHRILVNSAWHCS